MSRAPSDMPTNDPDTYALRRSIEGRDRSDDRRDKHRRDRAFRGRRGVDEAKQDLEEANQALSLVHLLRTVVQFRWITRAMPGRANWFDGLMGTTQ